MAFVARAWPRSPFALLSGIERYDTTLFSVHMVQHVLLTLVAAPLIALAGTDHAAAAGGLTGDAAPLDPAGPPRPGRRGSLAFPVVAWIVFAAVMWASHFSPLFDAALEDPLVHDLEHALYLGIGAAVLVAGRRARPGAVAHAPIPPAPCYVFLQMAQNTFLAVVLLEVRVRALPALRDARAAVGADAAGRPALAAGIMWVAGDLIFLGAIMAILVGWSRAEGRAMRPGRSAGGRGAGTDPGPRGAGSPNGCAASAGTPSSSSAGSGASR